MSTASYGLKQGTSKTQKKQTQNPEWLLALVGLFHPMTSRCSETGLVCHPLAIVSERASSWK